MSTDRIQKINEARLKYKPDIIKYLLISKAPPANNDRFFYYEDVQVHDGLFLKVMEVLYPELIEQYVSNKPRDCKLKIELLQKFKVQNNKS